MSQAVSHHVIPPRREVRGTRANTHARSEVLRMLRDDHRVAKSAFREFERLAHLDQADACAHIVRQTCIDLEIHTRLEEDVFYPAVRAALPDRGVIDDAEVEHQTMKMLMDQVRGAPMGNPRQSAAFRVLGEYVKHHVKEEEGEMFRQLSHARLDWARLLEDMQDRRTALTQELDDIGIVAYPHGSTVGIRPGLDGHRLRSGRHS